MVSMWGTGASASQCEGASPASAWWDWERAGIDVRRVFHWTGIDNYEWLHGFDVQFGLIDRDRNVRPSARVLQRHTGRAGRSAPH